MEGKICPICRRPLTDGVKYCTHCGAKRRILSETTRPGAPSSHQRQRDKTMLYDWAKQESAPSQISSQAAPGQQSRIALPQDNHKARQKAPESAAILDESFSPAKSDILEKGYLSPPKREKLQTSSQADGADVDELVEKSLTTHRPLSQDGLSYGRAADGFGAGKEDESSFYSIDDGASNGSGDGNRDSGPYQPHALVLQKRARPKKKKSNSLSTWGYFGSLLILILPVVGWIVGGFWAFGFCRKESKRNLARAALSLWGVIAAASLVLGVFFRMPILGAIEGFINGFHPVTVTSTPGGLGNQVPGQTFHPEQELAGPDPNMPVHFSGFPSAECLNLLMSDQYYIQYTSFAFGITTQREQAKGDGRFATIDTANGVTTRTLYMDGILYECNDEEKLYCLLGQGTPSSALPFGGTLNGLQRVGSGTGQVDGIECEYDEFKLQSTGTGQAERTVRLYVQDGVLRAIYMEEPLLGGEVMMRVSILSDAVPDGMLDLPSNYVKVEYDEMLHPSTIA